MNPEMNTAGPGYHETGEGAEIAPRQYRGTRSDLVRYAGASGDFNVIHWNERIAKAVGLPDVIAHGMLTMALAGRFLTEWAGDPAAVTEYGVRFSAPVVVPHDDQGAPVGGSGGGTRGPGHKDAPAPPPPPPPPAVTSVKRHHPPVVTAKLCS